MRVRIEELIGGFPSLARDVLLKLVDRGHSIGLDKRTISSRTRNFGTAIRNINISLAIGGCSKLLKKLEICKGGGIEG